MNAKLNNIRRRTFTLASRTVNHAAVQVAREIRSRRPLLSFPFLSFPFVSFRFVAPPVVFVSRSFDQETKQECYTYEYKEVWGVS